MSVYIIRPNICFEAGDWYIGSTTYPIKKRLGEHIRGYNCWKSGSVKRITTVYDLFDKYGVENCDIIEIEGDISPDQLKWRERHFLETIRCVNVMKRPVVTDEEKMERVRKNKKLYREQNKDTISEKQRLYREQNKEAIKEYQKLYYTRRK